jgi:hypothetical protein
MYDAAEYMRQHRARREAAGLCVTCGGEKERRDVQRCNECNRKNNDRVLERRYGITRDEYEELKAGQGHKCALCHTDLAGLGRSVHVDHDHDTGEVRGILCIECNLLIGWYEEILALNLAPVFDKYLGQATAQGLT